MANPDNYPVEIKVPDRPITIEGTRRNARMLLEYLEGWLNGRGAKGIDSLAGRPGVHPALMEDLATARISVAQIAQRTLHNARAADGGRAHDYAMVKRLLQSEVDDILAQLQTAGINAMSRAKCSQAEVRYRKALKIALRCFRNYTELNFSNGSDKIRVQSRRKS